MKIDLYIFAFQFALIAYTYSNILTERGMIFSGFYNRLNNILGVKYPYLFKPLIGCFKCVSGQSGLWSYLYLSLYEKQFVFSVLELIYFICVTIFISLIINFVYERIKEP